MPVKRVKPICGRPCEMGRQAWPIQEFMKQITSRKWNYLNGNWHLISIENRPCVPLYEVWKGQVVCRGSQQQDTGKRREGGAAQPSKPALRLRQDALQWGIESEEQVDRHCTVNEPQKSPQNGIANCSLSVVFLFVPIFLVNCVRHVSGWTWELSVGTRFCANALTCEPLRTVSSGHASTFIQLTVLSHFLILPVSSFRCFVFTALLQWGACTLQRDWAWTTATVHRIHVSTHAIERTQRLSIRKTGVQRLKPTKYYLRFVKRCIEICADWTTAVAALQVWMPETSNQTLFDFRCFAKLWVLESARWKVFQKRG